MMCSRRAQRCEVRGELMWWHVLCDLGSMTSVAKEIPIGKQKIGEKQCKFHTRHDRKFCK